MYIQKLPWIITTDPSKNKKGQVLIYWNGVDQEMQDEVNRNEVEITTYDRLLRAWENSMEMVRDFEMYSKRIEEEKIKGVFKQFAEDEGMHATKLRELLLDYRKNT
jgi:rubrerythrin